MEINEKVVAVVGGVGGAKLALGLSMIVPPENLTIIVNTGDDFVYYGLKICPDLDTVMYTLSGLVDPVQGWGVAEDSVITMESLQQYDEDVWFRLGDKDLATHLLRTSMLQNGERLTEVTAKLCQKLGIGAKILPMADDVVATVVDTLEYGELEFQAYFVKHRWQPTIKAIQYRGASTALLTPEVGTALRLANILLFAPSNPWLSIAPFLAIPEAADLILSRDIPKVAVTPIIDGKAVKGPAAKIMQELGLTVSPQTVAEYYRSHINGFVYDGRDGGFAVEGVRTVDMDTVMETSNDKKELALNVMSWIKDWNK